MKRFAQIEGGVVTRVVSLDDGLLLEEVASDIADPVECPDEVSPGWRYEAGSFSAPPPPPVDLLGYLADLRWQREIGGIVVGGHTIATDRASQGMIASADALAQADPEADIDFKAASGWVTLDAATLHVIALAVGRHVRGLFSRERVVSEAIAAGTITTTAEIDAAFAD